MLTSRTEVPQVGVAVRVAPRVEWLLAPNAGAWTFEGTNTWIVGDPSAATCAVIDPGPDDGRHGEALRATIGDRIVTEVVLTHGHDDHAGALASLVGETGAAVIAARRPDGAPTAHDGDRLTLAGAVAANIVSTPGHTRDSLCVHLPDDRVVFTGDTVLGAGSPVVHPKLLRSMLDSLRALERIGSTNTVSVLPGHGPVLPDLAAAVKRRIDARLRRIHQVDGLRSQGYSAVPVMVERMYPHLEHPDVVKAAHSSVQAMLTFLDEEQPEGQVSEQDRQR
ncbi:MBL fold metallo-hydrolase [Rhodococcus sp. BP-252]|uniref:MBL fold metallo-hydrolase n=1 Tax=unclassified Rhodococcus (in: high G+C Gram-positive bacteria) TaxID=192944 RepID=UPI001430E453|nr:MULTISPECIES: MBL fold metallo-hydrolase [unclassified Rhodococcus (in: high G+C Gram-positive bacteria)]MBY6410846.1 MBL fold metallo-hydrolase [Rhodococcus sp. BP-320]MBY6415329.1 MBL fold metallo-hydrolase [Rhodococcus sp. BP-321]MBY6419944.1 MBL fold metallo-hydrolase [Rhodococcus sp. BP-324]MBY6425402.1 MBL fold metallo-hydrolase [Rhodococcus sp. BP-323]MBY6430535.1 MBL fold metallo-hydrolase [Rhodococcus sp. BP-322]